jgi:hypothetical protein
MAKRNKPGSSTGLSTPLVPPLPYEFGTPLPPLLSSTVTPPLPSQANPVSPDRPGPSHNTTFRTYTYTFDLMSFHVEEAYSLTSEGAELAAMIGVIRALTTPGRTDSLSGEAGTLPRSPAVGHSSLSTCPTTTRPTSSLQSCRTSISGTCPRWAWWLPTVGSTGRSSAQERTRPGAEGSYYARSGCLRRY